MAQNFVASIVLNFGHVIRKCLDFELQWKNSLSNGLRLCFTAIATSIRRSVPVLVKQTWRKPVNALRTSTKSDNRTTPTKERTPKFIHFYERHHSLLKTVNAYGTSEEKVCIIMILGFQWITSDRFGLSGRNRARQRIQQDLLSRVTCTVKI